MATVHPRSGMGVDAADFDQDGREDLIVANIDTQMAALHRNTGNETFDDISLKTGVGPATRVMSGWSLRFFDYDNDGSLDLILSNGHPNDFIEQQKNGIKYRHPNLLLHNMTGTKTENGSDFAGPAFQRSNSSASTFWISVGEAHSIPKCIAQISMSDYFPINDLS